MTTTPNTPLMDSEGRCTNCRDYARDCICEPEWPTCIVCDETQHLRPCGLYGGATISTAYVCAAHDDPPRTICTGCDDAFRHPAETLTRWVGRFVYPWAEPEPIDGHYCTYCLEQIEHDAHYRGAAQ